MRGSSERRWGGRPWIHGTDIRHAREGTFRWSGVLEVSGIIGVFSDMGGACSGGRVGLCKYPGGVHQGCLISSPLSETRPGALRLGRRRGEDSWAGAAVDTRY